MNNGFMYKLDHVCIDDAQRNYLTRSWSNMIEETRLILENETIHNFFFIFLLINGKPSKALIRTYHCSFRRKLFLSAVCLVLTQ